MDNKRCGTCEYWKQITQFNNPPMGLCEYPIPKLPRAIKVKRNKSYSFRDEHSDCEFWSAKDRGFAEMGAER